MEILKYGVTLENKQNKKEGNHEDSPPFFV